MYAFVDAHRAAYGVEPICRVLQIAPSGYYAHHARRSDPARRSARTKRDEALRGEVGRVWRDHHEVYGVRKVWQQLHREGERVARCTVARLMRELGLVGVVRGRRVRTTQPAEAASARPRDLVQRQFSAERPNQLWVADFTYVATWRGFVYVAFVVDVFSRRLVGWRAQITMRTSLVLDASGQGVAVQRPLQTRLSRRLWHGAIAPKPSAEVPRTPAFAGRSPLQPAADEHRSAGRRAAVRRVAGRLLTHNRLTAHKRTDTVVEFVSRPQRELA